MEDILQSKKTSEKVKKEKLPIWLRLVIVFSSIIMFLSLFATSLLTFSLQVPKTFRVYQPSYDMVDTDKLVEIYRKDNISDDEYETLYRQTGLTKIGIDRLKKYDDRGEYKIKELQYCFYKEKIDKEKYENKEIQEEDVGYHYSYEPFTPFIQKSVTDYSHPLCYMKEGDILVSSSTFIFGLKAGHAALLTNVNKKVPEYSYALQAFGYSIPSGEETIIEFQYRSSSILLSPSLSIMKQIVKSEQYKKLLEEDTLLDDDVNDIDNWSESKIEDNARESIKYYAVNYLQGINYDITTGVLTPKKGTKKTQCAHIVWLAYNHFGVDIDKTKGLVVAPGDFVWSEKDTEKNKLDEPPLQPVQIFGADLDTMW